MRKCDSVKDAQVYSESPFASMCEGWECSPKISIILPRLAIQRIENNNECLDQWQDEREAKMKRDLWWFQELSGGEVM